MSLLRREDALEQPAKVLVKCWILLRRDQNYFLFVKKKNVIKFCASIFFKIVLSSKMVSVLQYCVLFVFCYASCKMLSVLKEDPQQKGRPSTETDRFG